MTPLQKLRMKFLNTEMAYSISDSNRKIILDLISEAYFAGMDLVKSSATAPTALSTRK